MFKGFSGAIWLAAALFMLPGVAWSEPHIPNYPVNSTLIGYKFTSNPNFPNANNLLNEVNIVRAGNGAQPLRPNKQLTLIAEQRAADMSVRQYYSHKSPEGLFYYDMMEKSNITLDYSCENLDLVFQYSANSVISDWMHSSKGHKECLLNADVYETGIAIVPYSTATIDGRPFTAYLVVTIHSTFI